VAIFITLTAAPIASAGLFWPFGPRGMPLFSLLLPSLNADQVDLRPERLSLKDLQGERFSTLMLQFASNVEPTNVAARSRDLLCALHNARLMMLSFHLRGTIVLCAKA
jgi:hypothetical protein